MTNKFKSLTTVEEKWGMASLRVVTMF